MKNITIILLAFLTLSCTAQDWCGYSEEFYNNSLDSVKVFAVDSVNMVCDEQIENYQEIITGMHQNRTFIGDIEISVLDTVDYSTVSLKKESFNLWYEIIKDSSRYNFWIVDNILEVWIGENNNASLIFMYDLSEKDLLYLEYEN